MIVLLAAAGSAGTATTTLIAEVLGGIAIGATVWSWSTRPTWMFVPPTSTPTVNTVHILPGKP